jgi:hypothetical protein
MVDVLGIFDRVHSIRHMTMGWQKHFAWLPVSAAGARIFQTLKYAKTAIQRYLYNQKSIFLTHSYAWAHQG